MHNPVDRYYTVLYKEFFFQVWTFDSRHPYDLSPNPHRPNEVNQTDALERAERNYMRILGEEIVRDSKIESRKKS